METITKEYVKVPNWYFDEILPHAPNTFSCVLAFILRETVGWHNNSFETTIKEIATATKTNKEVVSRYLWVLALVQWIQYKPARNGGDKSTISLGTLPTKELARDVAIAVGVTYPQRSCHVYRDNVKAWLLKHGKGGWVEKPATPPEASNRQPTPEDIDRMLEESQQEYLRRQAEKPATPSGHSGNAVR